MKIWKIILINLSIVLLLLFVSELSLFFTFKKTHPQIKYQLKRLHYKDSLKNTFPRSPSGLEYTNRPIILMGCSFIYGLFLEGEHTPQYKLSELTKRPVYNWALPGKGLQHALYILQNNLYEKDIKDPEYVIYVMIYDHLRRMFSPVMFSDESCFPVYDIDKNGIITKKSDYYPFYKKFLTYYYINNLIYFNFIQYDIQKSEDMCFAYFREIRRQIRKTYPDIKFVILLYDDWNKFGFNFSKLEKDGFIVLQTKELTGMNLLVREYQVSDTDKHPIEKAWDVVIPELAKQL